MKTIETLFLALGVMLSGLLAQPPKRTPPSPSPGVIVRPQTKPHTISVEVTADMAAALDKLVLNAKDKNGKPFVSTDDMLQALIQQNVSLRLLRQFPNQEILDKREALKKAQADLAAAEGRGLAVKQ